MNTPLPTHLPRPLLLAVLLLLLAMPARAQAPTAEPAVLTLDEAIQLALVHNYALRSAHLDLADADAQVKEGLGQLWPQVNFSSGYTRNLKSANPFAGSAAGGLFQSLGSIGWLAFNEAARTDGDAGTMPISLAEFFQRQQAGLDAAGIPPLDASANPFAIPNAFQTSVTLSQKILDMRAFWGANSARKFVPALAEAGLERQEQQVIDQVKQAYYQALLADEQVRVVAQSVGRTRRTAAEVGQQVVQGTAPKFQRLTAEVELANLETQLTQATTGAAAVQDNLKLILGLPANQPIRLRGSLVPEDEADFLRIAEADPVALALQHRADLRQARLNVELEHVQTRVARADYLPTISALANFSYIGNVPSNRINAISSPNDPFSFERQENGFFSDAYWQNSYNIGLQLNWTIFDGFQTRQRLQRRKIAESRASLQYDQLQQAIQIEVETALRSLRAAAARIGSQEQNVARASLNYEYAITRLREGLATPLEERQASELLDQSRLNYLQAVHDYLVAQSAFEFATGLPPALLDSTQLTTLDD